MQVFNEDCLLTMKRMADCSVDMVLTSPPYDNLRVYHGYSFDFNAISEELFRILNVGGVLVWVVADQVIKGSESGNSFRQALAFLELGFKLHDTMIWDKKDVYGTAGNPPTRYQQAFEYIFVFIKGKIKVFNPILSESVQAGRMYTGTTRRDRRKNTTTDCLTVVRDLQCKPTKIVNNIFTYPVGFNKTTTDKIAFQHPAIFPDKLAADMILSFTNEKALVYDPFAGSGTVGKMCVLTERKFIGSDTSEAYCKIADQRIKDAQYEFLKELL